MVAIPDRKWFEKRLRKALGKRPSRAAVDEYMRRYQEDAERLQDEQDDAL